MEEYVRTYVGLHYVDLALVEQGGLTRAPHRIRRILSHPIYPMPSCPVLSYLLLPVLAEEALGK